MDERLIYVGSRGNYYWLTSTEDYSGTLLRLCPEIVVGRHVAVTSVDSGIFRPTEEDLALGWRSHSGVCYSPKIQSSEDVPHQYHGPGNAGFDEFYVFDSPCELGERVQGNIFVEGFAPSDGRVVTFVSWGSFVLHDKAEQTLPDLFWPQLERIAPESYVGDGWHCLTFVSRKRDLVEALLRQLEPAVVSGIEAIGLHEL